MACKSPAHNRTCNILILFKQISPIRGNFKQKADFTLMRLHKIEKRGGHIKHRLHHPFFRRHQQSEFVVHLEEIAVENLHEDLLFRAEIVVEHRVGDAGLSGNHRRGGTFETIGLEKALRRLKNRSLRVFIHFFFHIVLVF